MFRSILNSVSQLLQSLKGNSPQTALLRFKRHEVQLREQFFQLASSSGKPRGLRWIRCDWQGHEVIFVEPGSGLLTLVAGVSIAFEAIEGGDMEGVEAASDLRDASAVFHYQNGNWGTGGRVLFNMDPATAAVRLGKTPTPPANPHGTR